MDVDKVTTTVSSKRITKQGVRDLNYYGPRAAKGVAGAAVPATVADEKIAPETGPAVTSAIEAHDKDAIK
jgi:hypothetical protein